MQENLVFELNERKKKINGLLTILVLLFVGAMAAVFFVFFRDLAMVKGSPVAQFITHVRTVLGSFDLLGVFYVGLFGGLFFLFFPMEAYFMKALGGNDPCFAFCFFMLGIAISYSADYLIGLKVSGISKKLISPKRFYTVKSYINRFGNSAILIANGVPFLPSQQVTFVLGVFRYNKARLLVLTLGGQALKALAIMGVHLLIFG